VIAEETVSYKCVVFSQTNHLTASLSTSVSCYSSTMAGLGSGPVILRYIIKPSSSFVSRDCIRGLFQ